MDAGGASGKQVANPEDVHGPIEQTDLKLLAKGNPVFIPTGEKQVGGLLGFFNFPRLADLPSARVRQSDHRNVMYAKKVTGSVNKRWLLVLEHGAKNLIFEKWE